MTGRLCLWLIGKSGPRSTVFSLANKLGANLELAAGTLWFTTRTKTTTKVYLSIGT